MENCIADVPFKGNGKSIRFFDDHLECNNKSIRYDNIETLAISGRSVIHTYIGIPLARSFDGGIQIKASNGESVTIVMNAMAMFGIPIIRNPRKNEALYPPLYEAFYNIVARSMAQTRIDMIRNGATVEVAS